MTRPPAKSGDANSRLPQPSRRHLLGATAAAPIFGAEGALRDPCAEVCKTWLARRSEHDRLGKRWQQIETRLFRDHNWPKLTRAQRKRFPEKHEMDDLYDRMDVLHEENRVLLASLPPIMATSSMGICGKLAIAAIEVCPEENEEAHRLIASILRDFRALHGG